MSIEAQSGGNIGPREIVIMGLVLVGFASVMARLYLVQIKQGDEFAEKSKENLFQIKRIEHDRGEIVDREGRVLVTNRPSLNVYITPAFLPRSRAMIEKLGSAIEMRREGIDAVGIAFRRTAAEEGPPILLGQSLDEAKVRALRSAQRAAEVPLLAVPIIEVAEGDSRSLASTVLIPTPPGMPKERRFAAYLDPQHFPSDTRIFYRLRDLIGLNPKEYDLMKKRVESASGLERYREIMVRHDLSAAVSERLLAEIDLGDLPGVTVRVARARDYRQGLLASHFLGYVNELTPNELEQRRDLGYRLGDLIGRRGVERTFEEDLRGVDGAETVVVDSKGRPQESRFAKQLAESFGEREDPRAGNRVVLTMDMDLQRVAETAFTAHAGSVVMIEVATGRVLVMTSTPTFDPNRVSGYFDPKEKARLDSMKVMRPWRFRPIQDHFAPGSTFKAVTAIAALTKKVTQPNETVNCPGAFHLGNTRFRCWKDAGHGPLATMDAITRSCDVYFYTMGNRMGLDALASIGFELGFGRKSGIPLDGEAEGIMPTEAWYDRHIPEGYTRGAAVNASIGQGAVAVTPLQLAVAYATIANGGTVYQPQVALRIEAFDGSAVREFEPKPLRRLDVPPEVLETVREGLRRVVNTPNGTAYSKRLKELEVSGKTGTAQVAKMGTRVRSEDIPEPLRDHAWFAAFAPSAAPEIAVVVMVEHGGHGGSAAAPAAMAVIKAWYQKKQAQQARAAAPPDLIMAEGEGWPPTE